MLRVTTDQETGDRCRDVAEYGEGIEGEEERQYPAFRTSRPIIRSHRCDHHTRPPQRRSEILDDQPQEAQPLYGTFQPSFQFRQHVEPFPQDAKR